jgi:hypothetical protein
VTVLSARAARHFDLEAPLGLVAAGERERALATLLEHGDRRDLSELFAAVPRTAAREWVRRHGGRRLSRRSRAFWTAVLDVETAPPPAAAGQLWPLA